MTTYFEQGGYNLSNRDARFNSLQYVTSYSNKKPICIDHGK